MIEHFQVKEDLSFSATWAAPCNGVVPSESGLIKDLLLLETLEAYKCSNWGPIFQCILEGGSLWPGFFYIFVWNLSFLVFIFSVQFLPVFFFHLPADISTSSHQPFSHLMLDLITNAAWAESIRFSSNIRMILSNTCNRCIGRTGAHQVHRLGSCIRLSCYLCNCNILSGLRDGAVFLNYFKAILSHSWYDWWHSTHKAKLWAQLKEQFKWELFKVRKICLPKCRCSAIEIFLSSIVTSWRPLPFNSPPIIICWVCCFLDAMASLARQSLSDFHSVLLRLR